MKLKGVTAQEKKVRVDFSLTESEAGRLEAYREYVAANSGSKVYTRELLALIVVQFMDEDRDFAKAQAQAQRLEPSHGILRGAGEPTNSQENH